MNDDVLSSDVQEEDGDAEFDPDEVDSDMFLDDGDGDLAANNDGGGGVVPDDADLDDEDAFEEDE